MHTSVKRWAITAGVAVAGVAALLTAAGPAAPDSASRLELRAWLGAQGGVPREGVGSGVFVAELQAGRLDWSLAYRRLGTGVVAELRLGSTVAKTLCAPCASTARGHTVLNAATVRALAAGKAYVDVRARQGSDALHGRIVPASVPTLEITSPRAGETISLPAEISYNVKGLAVATTGVHLDVYVAGVEARSVALALDGQTGSVTLPDVKDAYLVGKHDVSFQLATRQLVPMPNTEAKVTVRDLTIQGRRTVP